MSEQKQLPEGAALDRARRQQGMSIRRAASDAGISEAHWRHVVKGSRAVTPDIAAPVVAPAETLARMARAVGLGASDLLDAGREDAAEAFTSLWGSGGGPGDPKSAREVVGGLARRRRRELGLSLALFADEIGLGSDRTVQLFEMGQRTPSGVTAAKLERGLGWRSGVIEEVLTSDRDPAQIQMEDLDEWATPVRASRAADLSDDELLTELVMRWRDMRSRLDGTPEGDHVG